MPPYISLLRVIATAKTVRCSAWATSATIGRQSRATTRATVTTCASPRARCSRRRTTFGRTCSPFAPYEIKARIIISQSRSLARKMISALAFRAESLKSEENRVSGLPEEQKTMKNEKYSSSSADEMQKLQKNTRRRPTKCKK